MKSYAILGGGIIGLSLAYKLLLNDSKNKVVVYEKEPNPGIHQSTRNSGVIHCGLSYTPGSLKARLSYEGSKQLKIFCKENLIDIDHCGKIVVDQSINVLEQLARYGEKNGLKGLQILNKLEIKKLEPNLNSNIGLLVPEESVVDYKQVILKLKELILIKGGQIVCNFNILEHLEISKNIIGNEKYSYIINAAGLYSDKVFTILTGNKLDSQIIPFRGEYYALKEDHSDLFSNLIYEAPNSDFPFLGIHFTKHINGLKSIGPNAVLAFKREGYSIFDFDSKEFIESLSFKGLQKFILKNPKFCQKELYSSLNKDVFIKQAKKYFPEIKNSMFEKKIFSGVRAQSVGKSGNLILDFKIIKSQNKIHIINSPSPGASSSLAFADFLINSYL